MALLFAFLVGVFAGLRSLTPAASTAWAARLGWLRLPHQLAWIGATPLVVTFSLAALAELMLDKLPNAPSRTAPPGLLARIILGGLTGACVATAGGSGPDPGIVVGGVGGVVGCFGGYEARVRLVKALGTPDFVVALLEDFVAIGGSLWVLSRF